MVTTLIVALVGYILGSIPTGYIASRFAGIDIRTIGSGNVGATNVTRVLGKRFGYPVFCVDFAKGVAAILVARFLAERVQGTPLFIDLCLCVSGTAAVLGHSYPIWLRFKGGKGVATSIGVLFGIAWIAAVLLCIVWLIVFWLSRYVSLASIIATATLPIIMTAMFFLGRLQSPLLIYFSAALAAIVIFRHRPNLSRLFSGTESRFEPK